MSCVDFEVSSPIMVDANIQRWTITNDNIYLIKFNEAPPQWLEDMINNIIDDTGLPGDVGDLEDRFDNFEEGYTEHFYDWKYGDIETLAYVENIYTSNVVFNAGIQEIKTTYVSNAESGAVFDYLMGAWQTGAGGAWFSEQVSTVSNVAYAAAKSASTLTASLVSQQGQLDAIAGDIDVLESQVDGKVETWTGYHDIVDVNGDIIPTAEPYVSWLANNEVGIHTGDTYIKLEVDPVTGKDAIVASWNFTRDGVSLAYEWLLRTDDVATLAYQAALEANALADGKINTYWQPSPPTIIEDPTMGDGDLWLDSDDGNKMYRYNGTSWLPVRDSDIVASVNRLDEATVDVDGVATARSSLVVDADGNISGYRASATNDPTNPGSEFRIFADRFTLASTDGQPAGYAPMTVDTTTNEISFNGLVSFTNIRTDTGADPMWLFAGDAAEDINRHTTTIDGGKITTYSLNANRIAVDTLWARGMIASEEQRNNTTGYIGNTDPAGFLINGKADEGSFNYPNIYGAYIRGGYIYGATMEASTMKVRDLIVLTDADYPTHSACNLFPDESGWDFYPYNSADGGSRDNRAAAASGSIVSFAGDQYHLESGTLGSNTLRGNGANIILVKYIGDANNPYVSIGVRVYVGTTIRSEFELDFRCTGYIDCTGILQKTVFGITFRKELISSGCYLACTINNTLKDFSGEGEFRVAVRGLEDIHDSTNDVWTDWSYVRPLSGMLYNT